MTGVPQTQHRLQPSQWQELPRGEWLAEQVGAHLAEWWPRLYGHHLVKLGPLSAELPSFNSPIAHQICTGTDTPHCASGNGVLGQPEALPFTKNAVDLVLAAHCLEFSDSPQQVLRECARITAPYGHVIIVGFNPYSLLGLGRYLPRTRKRLPWCSQFIPPRRVADWLQLLGFEILADDRLVFSRIAGGEPRWFGQWCETLGSNYWSQLGGVYLLVARKQVLPMTPTKRVAVFRRRLEPVGAARALWRKPKDSHG